MSKRVQMARRALDVNGDTAPLEVERAVEPADELEFVTAGVQAPELRIVVDITGDVIAVDLRPMLTPEAALLNAPRSRVRTKRVLDVLGSIAAMTLLSPIFLVVATAVMLTSPGPVIFRQVRVGKDGKEFYFYKFRSMRVNAEAEREDLQEHNESIGPVFKIKDDPRLTRIGRLIRRTSLDELPQLWNVLKGEMSLVGPRPPIPGEVGKYSEWESQRLVVKPGITCIWQVSGRSEIDFDTWVKMDIDYIENWSLRNDISLLAKTVPAVLSRRGAY